MFSKSKNEVLCYRKSDLICTVVCEDAINKQYTLDKVASEQKYHIGNVGVHFVG